MSTNELLPLFRKNEVLAITSEGYDQMVRMAESGKKMRDAAGPAARGTVAVIPIKGPILYFDSWMGVNTNRIGDAIEAAADSPRVSKIVLDIDSPGGTSYMTQELSDRILVAGEKKRIEAVANPLSASAAYWIGSAAHRLYATPSGDVGSLGTYQMHVDYSKAMEDMGIQVTFIHAGKNKVEWSPYHELKQETIDHAQEEVNQVNDLFMSDVARNRGVPKSVVTSAAWGQGRTLIASRALAVGMIDGIRTLNNVVSDRPSKTHTRSVAAMNTQAQITDLLNESWENGYSSRFTPVNDGLRDQIVTRRRDRERATLAMAKLTQK
ncbi:S49 family peptidase [Bremerella sp. T1]|uniref:S49 family peptidase n=1 Tax=Bremerella sp. TYQ1 TaxID=3119568 RepID=UPI001CC9B753|nr:S49 family peptidase [Bremerella volcania]UBM38374.1 S49 family peptidase [Bremerella volcania]